LTKYTKGVVAIIMETIKIIPSTHLKSKPANESTLGFGKYFTDHMLTMNYSTDKGWYDLRIEPYHAFSMDPSTMVFHYGQAIFEGMKAYKAADGRTLLFRPQDNFLRMNQSARRMCMPEIDIELVLGGLNQLITLERAWIPSSSGTSLYIRPTMIAVDTALGVHPSNSYIFFIILSPVGAYYAEGLKPIKIYVEDQFVRAVKGGTGDVKTAGNYAASLLAGKEAYEKGYTQVLWLDGLERKYIEEVGAMNIFFKIDGKLITPALQGSILGGITRDSVIQIAHKFGWVLEERPVTMEEVYQAHQKGVLEEVFGTGTAAVISAVGELNWKGHIIVVNEGKMGIVAQTIYDTLTGIQLGSREDWFGWSKEVK